MSFVGAVLEQRARRFQIVGGESISQNPSEPLIAALGGAPSLSGATVTVQTVQGIPAGFTCDRVLSESVAQAPIKLMRRNNDGTRTADVNHPLYTILHDLANPAMSAFEFKETMQGSLNLWGNGYAEVKRDRTNTIQALWPLDPGRMTVDLDGLNRLRYTYQMAIGKPKEWIFDPANPPILHVRQNARDGIHGRSPVSVLREAMGLALAGQDAAARFYGQGMMTAGAVQTEAKLDRPAASRVREDLERILAGGGNFHRIAILDRGLKWQAIGMPAKDAEFLETRKFARSELAGAFRVPSHMVNDQEKATFSNIEHLSINFVQFSLMSHFIRWQQAIARDLLNPRSFNTHFAIFVVDSLIRGDTASQNAALTQQRQNGVINANEWRRLIDMDDRIAEADGGNLYLVNGNMMPMQRDPAGMIEEAPGAMN